MMNFDGRTNPPPSNPFLPSSSSWVEFSLLTLFVCTVLHIITLIFSYKSVGI